ncbi:MAG: TIGR02710 family CRISPR-associated CARF protein [Desulfotomaculaceae bacterium]|nr:TIGR02710 family CRISPR-associated CARF protein [Desulfotomaculaceae bacterium]
MDKPKAMIISVGGSPEPLIISIKENCPEFICFFASEQSVDKIGEIKQAVGYTFKDCKVFLNDPQDLTECYIKSQDCVKRLREAGYSREDVLVDFTGGTKPMSGMLLSSSLSEGYNFVYVGGTKREKDGLGIVKNGAEVVIKGHNPWNFYAVEQRKKLRLYFNSGQFTACQAIIRDALEQCQPDSAEVELFKGLSLTVSGYLEWDRFEHKEARKLLSEGYGLLSLFARLTGNKNIKSFNSGVADNLDYLNTFASRTRGYKDISRYHVLDLLSNSRRRFLEGRYDDAIARLYRALEMTAQWKLQTAYGINTSKVMPEQVPVVIREQYVFKYGKGDVLQIPLAASFGLLEALGDEACKVFNDLQVEITKILSVRNSSILAHGVQPVDGENYSKFLCTIMQLCGVAENEVPEFPELDI